MPRPIDIIAVPWDSGRRGWRMGAGPAAIVNAGLARTLADWGHDVRTADVDAPAGAAPDPFAATMDLVATTAERVQRAQGEGRFPVVLSGNCMATVGAVAGLDGADVAVAWFDAHGDLHTPETSTSGFLDGMAAAALLGWCFQDATARVQGFRPLPVSRFLLIGARDLDPGEVSAAEREAVRVLAPADTASETLLGRALDDLIGEAKGVWLHVDLDVLDPAARAPANEFTPPGGLEFVPLVRAVQECVARGRVLGLTISAYDPSYDPDGLLAGAVLPLVVEAAWEEVYPSPGSS